MEKLSCAHLYSTCYLLQSSYVRIGFAAGGSSQIGGHSDSDCDRESVAVAAIEAVGSAAAHEGTADVPEKGAQSTRRRQRQAECERRQRQTAAVADARSGGGGGALRKTLFPGTYASATQGGSRERRAAAAVAHEVDKCFAEGGHEYAAVTISN